MQKFQFDFVLHSKLSTGIMEYNAKERSCGWCYAMKPTMRCSKCPRAYCCRECQINDWKVGCHKVWCGKSGEKCIDYEIRDAGEGKGLGLFTLRDFERGEKILVERAVAVATQPAGAMDRPIDFSKLHESASLMSAAMALTPMESTSLPEKFLTNSAALGSEDEEAGSGLFLNFSRVNHDCIGNANHYYTPDQKLKLLVTNHAIPAGSEVTFSYAGTVLSCQRAIMIRFRGFQCTCAACQNPEIAAKLDRAVDLDRNILELGRWGKTEQAIRAGESLLKIHDEFQVSDRLYSRVYYDLYQIAITRKSTLKLGSRYIKQAYTHALRFYGRKEDETVMRMKHFMENPSAHRNYRCID